MKEKKKIHEKHENINSQSDKLNEIICSSPIFKIQYNFVFVSIK